MEAMPRKVPGVDEVAQLRAGKGTQQGGFEADKVSGAEVMGQVSVTALRAVALPETQNTVTAQERLRMQAIVSAVQVVNQAGLAGDNREVAYSMDSATRQMVIRVVDTQSREVIAQWPSDVVLRLAEHYKDGNSQR